MNIEMVKENIRMPYKSNNFVNFDKINLFALQNVNNFVLLIQVLVIILIFYAGIAAPKLPKFIIKLFKLSLFRVIVLSLIVYNGNKNPTLSILTSVGFILIMDRINKKEVISKEKSKLYRSKVIKEKFADVVEDEIECSNFPMPGRIILSFESRPDGTCKFYYFDPSDGNDEKDCGLCANKPKPGRRVMECDPMLGAGSIQAGTCTYEYHPEEEALPSMNDIMKDEFQEDETGQDEVDMNEIQKLIDEANSDLETMIALADKNYKK